MTVAAMGVDDVVRLAIPASTAYVGVARSLAAGIATRLDLDLDHVEDLRLAVSEACAVLLPDATPGATLDLVVQVAEAGLVVELSTATSGAPMPAAPDSFAWTVLSALADGVATERVDGRTSIRLEFMAGTDPVVPDGARGSTGT
ncbi:MAG: anti-sigma regulatory factor [Jiangellales bacterium]